MHTRLLIRIACLLILSPACHGLGVGPRRLRQLDRVLSPYGFARLERHEDTITATSPFARLAFTLDSRRLQFGDTMLLMNAPLVEKKGSCFLAAADVSTTLDPLLRSSRLLRSLGLKKVVLDPGHGGTDHGAQGVQGVLEKRMSLDTAKRVAERLEAAGVEVLLTRTGDRALSLAARTEAAARWKADLFVSIHFNSSANRAATGIETYVVPYAGFPSTSSTTASCGACRGNRHDKLNMLLAYSLHKDVLAQTGSVDRGIRRARFVVLRDAPCPAALIECGFLSSRSEENSIMQPEYRDTLAAGIAHGILDLIKRSRNRSRDQHP